MVDKDKILAGRQAVDAYRAAHGQLRHRVRDGQILPIDHTAIMEEMVSELKRLGFNSTQEFHDANTEACLAELKRCYRMEGVCDNCEGRQRGCIEKCYQERKGAGDRVYFTWNGFYDWQNFEGNHPPTCTLLFVKVAEPTFDFFWGMPSGLTLDHYQEMKQRE